MGYLEDKRVRDAVYKVLRAKNSSKKAKIKNGSALTSNKPSAIIKDR